MYDREQMGPNLKAELEAIDAEYDARMKAINTKFKRRMIFWLAANVVSLPAFIALWAVLRVNGIVVLNGAIMQWAIPFLYGILVGAAIIVIAEKLERWTRPDK